MAIQLFTNSLWDKIARNASIQPDKLVLKDTVGGSRSYCSFVKNVNGFAQELDRRGVIRGGRVLFLERPSIRSIEIFFAIYRLGAVAVIADPAMGRENFQSRVEFSDCKYAVLDRTLNILSHIPGAISLLRKYRPSVPDLNITLPELIVLPKTPSQISDGFSEMILEDNEDSLIIFTSGTTSVPKGVVHSFGSLLQTLELIQEKIGAGNGDVFLSSQLHFSIIALITGAASVIDVGTGFSAGNFTRSVEKYRPTHTFLLPSEGQQIVDLYKRTYRELPDTLKCVMFGSAPVLVGFLKKFSAVTPPSTQVLSIYGSTEILPISIATMKKKLTYTGEGDYLGTLLPNVSVKIVDDEFLVQGPNLCGRYLHEELGLKYFASGDLGYVTPEGDLVLTGRKKDMIIKNHHNVYPTLFEATISKIEGVKNCALIGVYNVEDQDEKIHLCIEKENIEMSDQVFIEYLGKKLKSGEYSIDSYALPDKIHVMTLPLSGRSRKIDKQTLRTNLTEKV
jgi:acyl-CoA synthetase (AMP-forming)/AMP-acid ligase II